MGGAQSVTAADVAEPQVDGVLDKQSDHVKAWRQRYFRLDAAGHKLDYWDFESEAGAGNPPKSSVPLLGGFVEEVSEAAGSRSSLDYPFQFRVRGSSEDESFTLNAASDRERKQWMAQIYLASLPTKSGMVFKCSDHLGQWRPRFVRLEFGRLFYWETEADSKALPVPKGVLRLQGGRVVQLPAANETRRYVFAVHEPDAEGREGRHYMLCATSQADYEAWKKAAELSVVPWQRHTQGQRFSQAAEKMKTAQRDEARAESAQADRFASNLRTKQMKRDKANTTAADMRAKYASAR